MVLRVSKFIGVMALCAAAMAAGTVSATASNAGKAGIAYGFIAENGDSDESNNSGIARASVPGATSAMEILSFHDANGDHRIDPGEGVASVKVTVVGLYDIEHIETAYTDQDGKFRFAGLPVGEYEVRVTPPLGGGWCTAAT